MRIGTAAVVGVVVAVGALALLSRSGNQSAGDVDATDFVPSTADSGPDLLAEKAPPLARIRLGDLGAPVASSASCDLARGRAAELEAELAREVTASERDAADQSVRDALARGQSEAEAYDLFAGGAALEARFAVAAWGALEAAARQWRPAFVSNIGVYLLYLDRLEDAELFLTCARELDPRSPFTIEAQAMLALERGDCDEAKRLVATAVQLLPGDMNVRYTAGIIEHRCGDRVRAVQYLRDAELLMPDDETVREALRAIAGSGSAVPRERDSLDRLVGECLAFLDQTVARAELASDYDNLIQAELFAGGWTESDFAEQTRSHAAYHRQRIRELENQARNGQSGRPDAFAWNQTVYECVNAYSEAASDYQLMSLPTAPIVIMAMAMRMEPVVLASKYAIVVQDRVDWVLLDADDAFYEALRPVDDALVRCIEADGATEACYRAWCGAAVPLWQSYRATVAGNMMSAEDGYPGAAEDYGNYWLDYVQRVDDFARRSIDLLKPVPGTPGAQQQEAELIAELAGIHTDGMMEFLVAKLGETSGYLQNALRYAPDELLAAADSGPNGRGSTCTQQRPDEVAVDPPLDPFLEALAAATSSSVDPQFVDCEVKVGNFSVSVKSAGRGVEVKLGEKIGESTSAGVVAKPGARFGGEVSYSQSGSAHGVAAKATVKLWGEAGGGRATAYGAQLEGKLGVGVSAGGQGLSCYFVSAKATFNARAFADALRA
jgi:Flp pilus assembly protein TadD